MMVVRLEGDWPIPAAGPKTNLPTVALLAAPPAETDELKLDTVACVVDEDVVVDAVVVAG